MARTCIICANKIPVLRDRYRLTSKLIRNTNLTYRSVAEVLKNNWGVRVPLSSPWEDEHSYSLGQGPLYICRACRLTLSTVTAKRHDFNVALSKLYDKSAPTAYIGRELREFISTLRGEVSISTPSSASSCARTPCGQKRSTSTTSQRRPLKKPRFSRSTGSSNPKAQDPRHTLGGGSCHCQENESPSSLRQVTVSSLLSSLQSRD